MSIFPRKIPPWRGPGSRPWPGPRTSSDWTELVVRGVFNPDGYRSIGANPAWAGLRKLTVCDDELSGDHIDALLGGPTLLGVEELRFEESRLGLGSIGRLVRWLPTQPRLRHIALSRCDVANVLGDELLRRLADAFDPDRGRHAGDRLPTVRPGRDRRAASDVRGAVAGAYEMTANGPHYDPGSRRDAERAGRRSRLGPALWARLATSRRACRSTRLTGESGPSFWIRVASSAAAHRASEMSIVGTSGTSTDGFVMTRDPEPPCSGGRRGIMNPPESGCKGNLGNDECPPFPPQLPAAEAEGRWGVTLARRCARNGRRADLATGPACVLTSTPRTHRDGRVYAIGGRPPGVGLVVSGIPDPTPPNGIGCAPSPGGVIGMAGPLIGPDSGNGPGGPVGAPTAGGDRPASPGAERRDRRVERVGHRAATRGVGGDRHRRSLGEQREAADLRVVPGGELHPGDVGFVVRPREEQGVALPEPLVHRHQFSQGVLVERPPVEPPPGRAPRPSRVWCRRTSRWSALPAARTNWTPGAVQEHLPDQPRTHRPVAGRVGQVPDLVPPDHRQFGRRGLLVTLTGHFTP